MPDTKLEELAKELFEAGLLPGDTPFNNWLNITSIHRERWILVARAVAVMVVEAEIKVLKKYGFCSCKAWDPLDKLCAGCQKIKELTAKKS